jgi:hypothetical protein
MTAMDLLTELTHTTTNPAVIAAVRALLEHNETSQQRLLVQEDKLLALDDELRAKDAKIAALTFEPATYRRLRFGKKSETFHGQQQDLFEETCDADLAAIEAELTKQQSNVNATSQTTKPPVAEQVANPYPVNYPASRTAMNLIHVNVPPAAKRLCWSAEISANNSTLNLRDFLFTATSAPTMLVANAKP